MITNYFGKRKVTIDLEKDDRSDEPPAKQPLPKSTPNTEKKYSKHTRTDNFTEKNIHDRMLTMNVTKPPKGITYFFSL